MNDVCTSYLQPENGLCHVGVLEVGCAGVPGILGDTIVQVDHLGSTHLQEGKKKHKKLTQRTARKDSDCLKRGNKVQVYS